MIVFLAGLAGVILGGLTAKKRDGGAADIAQYATAFGIAFALIGLLATIAIHRMAI